MNKAEFIDILSKELNTTKVAAGNIVDAVFKTIVHTMKKTDELRFVGFGTFKAKQTKAREVTIPKGETVKVPAQRQVKLSIGQTFKDAVNSK